MQFDGLHAVADYAALYTSLRQAAFADFLCERLGVFDVRCDDASRSVVFTSRTAGSERATSVSAESDCGPAHPCGEQAGPASTLRETGMKLGIDEFAAPRVALPPKDSPEADTTTRVVDIIAAAAVESSGVSPYCTVRLDDGSRSVFLLEDIPLPEPTFADFATGMPNVMSPLAVTDHRVAIHGMAARRGWHISWRTGSDGGRSPICDVTDGRSVAHVDFDRRGRPVDYRCELADVDQT